MIRYWPYHASVPAMSSHAILAAWLNLFALGQALRKVSHSPPPPHTKKYFRGHITTHPIQPIGAFFSLGQALYALYSIQSSLARKQSIENSNKETLSFLRLLATGLGGGGGWGGEVPGGA